MTKATDPRPFEAIDLPLERRVDFDRSLVCILGLPFDSIDTSEAVRRIREAAFDGRRCFVSTPNLNFAISARRDAAFRGSVLRSDLSLIDGMPLVWIARLLRLNVPERVSGADVFEALQAHAGPPVRVYLFGGPPGAGEQACEGINRRGGGMVCVGHESPGFGDVESMSGEDRIARINRSGAQFVVVSLGAAKGQAWIEHNAARLVAPVLSHLGAVVNFAAGTLARAPSWMRSLGLEWLWRIKEEPELWRRYWRDGSAVSRLLLTEVRRDALVSYRERGLDLQASTPQLERTRTPAGHMLVLSGDWRGHGGLPALRTALAACAAESVPLTIDIAGVTGMGNTVTALLLVAQGWFQAHGGWRVIGARAETAAALRRRLADDAILGAER